MVVSSSQMSLKWQSKTSATNQTSSNDKSKITKAENDEGLNFNCGSDNNVNMQEVYDYKDGKSEMVTYDDQGNEKYTQTAKPDGSWGEPKDFGQGKGIFPGGFADFLNNFFNRMGLVPHK